MPRRKKSKKRSGSTEVWQPSQTYFVDIALGKFSIPDALREAGASIEVHTDHFPPNAPDTEWIGPVAKRGWAILTKDRDIQRNPLERDTVMSSRACYVCVRGGQRSGPELATNLVRLLKRIDGVAEASTWPVIMRVLRGEVKVHINDEWVSSRVCHTNARWWHKHINPLKR